MLTKLIRLEDGTLVEVGVSAEHAQEISGGFASKVNTSFEAMQNVLLRVYKPIVKAWSELNKDMNVESAEIEVGLSFEGEGNLYVTRSKANANLVIKLTLKPKD